MSRAANSPAGEPVSAIGLPSGDRDDQGSVLQMVTASMAARLAGRRLPRLAEQVAQVRLVGPPDVVDAALALLGDLLGEAWQPSTRKPGRHEGGDHLQYGTLIVPIPRG